MHLEVTNNTGVAVFSALKINGVEQTRVQKATVTLDPTDLVRVTLEAEVDGLDLDLTDPHVVVMPICPHCRTDKAEQQERDMAWAEYLERHGEDEVGRRVQERRADQGLPVPRA